MSGAGPLVILAASAVAAALAGYLLHAAGGAAGRPWAVPVAAAIGVGGAGYAFDLPGWVLVIGFVAATFLANRSAKARQDGAARQLDRVGLAKGKTELRRIKDPSGKFLYIWRALPPKEDPERGPGPEVGLEFAGEDADEFRVIVASRAGKFRPGAAVAHHCDARGEPLGLLPGAESVSGLPGMAGDMIVRTLPTDFAFSFFDEHSLAVIRDALELRRPEREVYFQLEGPAARFVSAGLLSAGDLRVLVPAVHELAERADFLGREEG